MKRATIKERKLRLEALEIAYDSLIQNMDWLLHDWRNGERVELTYEELEDEQKEKYDTFKAVADMIAELE